MGNSGTKKKTFKIKKEINIKIEQKKMTSRFEKTQT